MSCLGKLSSSSDTVRSPMYQNIQKIRLRKISKGPDITKKSQKLNGAKIPMKKRIRPTMSKIKASARNVLLHLFGSIAGTDETGRWTSSEGLTRLKSLCFLSWGTFFFLSSTPLHFFHSRALWKNWSKNQNNGFCSLTDLSNPTARLHSSEGLTCFAPSTCHYCDTSTHCLKPV